MVQFPSLVVVYLLMEMIWISTMTPILYNDVFSSIQKSPLELNLYYAICAYILLLVTIKYICIPLSKTKIPGTSRSYDWMAFSLVGLIIYGIYNTTNGAVLKQYPLQMCIIDTLWGVSIFSILGMLHDEF